MAASLIAWCAQDVRTLGGTTSSQFVVVREALFSHFTQSDTVFRASPGELRTQGFLEDPLAVSTASGGILRPSVTAGTVPDRVRALAREIPWFNSPSCARGASMAEKRRRLDLQRTCCSDNVELLLAQAAYEGLFAREVHLGGHVVAEVWDPAASSWVFVDPGFGVMAFDARGSALSTFDVRACKLDGGACDLRVMRDASIATAEVLHPYDERSDYELIGVVLGNNVFTVDARRARLAGLPYALVQGTGFLTGTEPRTLLLIDDDATATRRYQALRMKLALTALTSGAAVVLWMSLAWSRVRAWRARRGSAALSV